MAFNSYNLIVRIFKKDGSYLDVKCPTLQQARTVIALNYKAEIVGNY